MRSRPIQRRHSSPIVCFLISHILEIIFDKEFYRRPLTTKRDVIPVHGCHDMYALDVALPHTRAGAPSRQLESAECRGVACAVCCISWIAAARTCVRHLPGTLLAAVRRIFFFVLERRSTPFAHQPVPQTFPVAISDSTTFSASSGGVDANNSGLACVLNSFAINVGLPWLPLVSLSPSCLDGCLARLAWARLQGHSCTSCGDECTPLLHSSETNHWPLLSSQCHPLHNLSSSC